jgi:hypothetical protein
MTSTRRLTGRRRPGPHRQGSTTCYRGTGGCEHHKVGRPDLGRHRARLHHRLRRQPSRPERRLALRAVGRHVPGRRLPLGLRGRRGRRTAFTKDGIDNLRQIIAEERAAGREPPPGKSRQIERPAVLTAWILRASSKVQKSSRASSC